MGFVRCKSCDGIGRKYLDRYDKNGRYYQKEVPCKACNGTGINQKFYSKNCEKCYAEIIYPRDATCPPRLCKACKEREQYEREQARAREAAKWKEKQCKKCWATIKYNIDWNKIPELCPECIAKEKAKWKTKPCKNCYREIKYNIDWNKIPELCPECIAKEKAKWKVKPCEACGRDVKYNTDWPKPPRFCRDCANVLRVLKGKEGINKAKALDLFHTRPQILQSGVKKSGNYVTVKSGYNYSHGLICSDFIIRDKNVKGQHYHVIIDIDGNIIFEGYRND